MIKHFVQFFSPGTLISEVTERPIDSWDVDKAVEMSKTVLERHNARPYGFRFITRKRGNKDLDSHVAKTSNMYYLGGVVYTLEDVESRNDPHDKILISNMKNNNIDRIIVNTNSWKFTGALEKGDVVLDV